jgi:hypothetical protein
VTQQLHPRSPGDWLVVAGDGRMSRTTHAAGGRRGPRVGLGGLGGNGVSVSPTFEERLAALEARVGTEASLRAAVDHDLGTLSERQRAANHLIQALSITQGEHTETLARHTELLTSAHSKLDLIIELLRGQMSESSQE